MTDPSEPSRSDDRDIDDKAPLKTDEKRKRQPEGPHATPENTNHEATPVAGALPDGDDQDATG